MRANPTFFWYDLETFGLDSRYDKIAQFAGQRTDLDLNPVGDPVVLYCRPPMDYLPNPESCLVTGITPQTALSRGLPESEFIEKVNDEFSVPNTCVAGFNSIRFDDEFIRNALYRNFLNPYSREWRNNNSRWDIIDVARAAHDFKPDSFRWPPKNPENGNPVFKLTELTEANEIPQRGAHDALVDVNATIDLAKMLKAREPRLFDYFYTHRGKAASKELLAGKFAEPCLCTAPAFTSPNGCTAIITPLATVSANSVLCFDLSKDVGVLISADPDSLLHTPGLVWVGLNKCPALSPLAALGVGRREERLGLNLKAALAKNAILRQHRELITKLFQKSEEEKPGPAPSADPDFQIYSGFFSDYDAANFEVVRKAPPEQRLRLNLRFQDPRCQEMLRRHVCRNYPEVLDPDARRSWKAFCKDRLNCPPGPATRGFEGYQRTLWELSEKSGVTEKDKAILRDLADYGEKLKKELG